MPEVLTGRSRARMRRAGPCFLLALVAAPAAAQNAVPSARPEPRIIYGDGPRAPAILADPATSRTTDMVDESALRYYAAQKQTARMKAEIARLKRLYPGWNEPPDLNALQPSPPEEAALWDLFTAGRFDDLRAAIAARRSIDPAWQPSEELARKLRRAEFRSRITALTGKESSAIIDLYRADPGALDPLDVQSIWMVADALGDSGSGDEAFELYKSILDGNADSGVRLATIQKTMAHLRMAQAERLIEMGHRGPNGTSEFDAIRLDITRARIAAFLHEESAESPTPADLAAFQTVARKSGDPSQTSLLGWYAYKRRQYREALEWFKHAIARGGDAMVAHGLALTLRQLDMQREAEEVAYAWRDRFVGNELLYIDILEQKLTLPRPPAIEPARIARYAQVVTATTSGEGAQGLAWYAYNSCQFDTALEWFQRGVAWMPSEGTVFGYALTLQRLKRQRPFLETVNRYDGLFPKAVDLLFQDATAGSPLPCDPAPPVAAAAPGRHAAAPGRAEVAPLNRVPRPDLPNAAADAKPIAVQRNEFPLAVSMENGLRYPPPGLARILAEPVPAGTYAREPTASAPPLVARRVPGAGPMPYERFGYALLPDYRGGDKPELLSSPAPGTLWQDQQAERGRPDNSEAKRFQLPARSAFDTSATTERTGP
ncbi:MULTISPECIES: hypothetical protein [unclassified Methylobacterium]|uniref:hypothetical protein n=1 Tax=unclassified Methylobacterium TaxID=2615210 RepID=UPI0011C1D7EC|nr:MULTISPECIES: hypothetical protein [unclassified Methylobacterium]QEE41265.1 hypothetical protein FVA80_22160 [Methylobacterium sp. WL1]TXN55052.1 hypothetical protein FV241_21585 [Methylobacterium sp. WL2]